MRVTTLFRKILGVTQMVVEGIQIGDCGLSLQCDRSGRKGGAVFVVSPLKDLIPPRLDAGATWG